MNNEMTNETNNETTGEMTVVRSLPPEEIRAGMFVAVMCETFEVFPPTVFDVAAGQSVRPFKITCLNRADGEPRRVLSVCLPFVQVETPEGVLSTFDVRRHSLAAVSEMYGLEAFTRPRIRADED